MYYAAFAAFMSSKLLVEGGVSLKGDFKLAGAKNAVLKMMAAALLTSEEVVIRNAPRISDVDDMLEAFKFMGIRSAWSGDHEVTIQASECKLKALPVDLAGRIRASFMVFGSLLARFGEAAIPDPGGDKIGRRPVDRHIEGFKKLGAQIKYQDEFFQAKGKLQGTTIRFPKNTHMGTENLIVGSCLASGETILQNAAQEPEVDNLIFMLNSMGAKVKRIKPRVIQIEGVKKLTGTTVEVIPDRIEAGTLAVAAAVSRGEVLVKKAKAEHLTAFLSKFSESGGQYRVSDEGIRFWAEENQDFASVDITTLPHPGFMTDWGPPFAVLLTQAHGESIYHETIFPNRFHFLEQLKKMGTEATLFNPEVENAAEYYNFDPQDDDPSFFHAARIFGPIPLVGTKIKMLDIRAGATCLIAALVAKGTSEITGISHLDRGYEYLVEKLQELGARIERIEE